MKKKIVTDVECWEMFPVLYFSSEAQIRDCWRDCEEAELEVRLGQADLLLGSC